MCSSAWWGQSFVTELTRISEQAEKKLRVRRGSLLESGDISSPPSTAPEIAISGGAMITP